MNACTSNPTPTEQAGLPLLALADYTIVYPSEYTQLRMDIVNDIQSAIEGLTNVRIKAVPDSEAKSEKEIILASSKRVTDYDEQIDSFASRMDYIIAENGNDIVLGGQNYYSDMRAVYDFINNYLGYDTIGQTYSEPTKKISGTSVNIYKEPEFIIQAACWATLFDKESYIKDIKDANFNMLMTQFYMTPEQIHNLTKWCTKYEISLMANVAGQSDLPNVDIYYDCPMMWGSYIWDEPSEDQFEFVQKLCDEFTEKYSKYGFKPFVNYAGERADSVKESELLKDLDILSFDWYIFVNNFPDGTCGTVGEGSYYLDYMQTFRETAQEHGMDFWTYIQAYRRTGGIFKADTAYKWQMYMNLCFGSKAMLYFMYSNQSEAEPSWGYFDTLVLNRDFSKGENYYYAQAANAELMKVYDILKDYNNVGACTYYKRNSQLYADFDEYEDFGVIEDVESAGGIIGYDSYLAGCFEKKDSNGKAFIFMNLEILKEQPSISFPVRIKINGENIKCYSNGELLDISADEEGYYTLDVPNGACFLFTVE